MSSQSSGEKPPDDSGKVGQPLRIPSSKPSQSNAPYQTLSKTLSRPVLQMQNVGGVIPPAHSAQSLQAFLPAAAGLPQGLLAGNIDVNKPSLTANPINFSTLTPASTSSTSMMSSTQIVRVATPGTSQPSIVQISAPTSVTSTSQHGTDGSILKPHIQTAYPSHLPRGAAAAASVLAAPKSNTAVPMLRPSQHAVPTSSSATGIHGSRGSLITTTPIRTTTPPLNRPISPAVSVATTLSDPHRQMKPLPSTTAMNTAPSIQITLQTANRANTDLTQKQIITHQQPVQKPVHLSHGMALSSSKMLMSQTSVTQHSVLSNISKTNKSTVPVSSIASFPAAAAVTHSNLTMTSVPISSINSLSAASSIIPVAKVNPVRQQQPSSISSHLPSRPVTTTHDRTEPLTQAQSTAMFLPQAHRPITSTMTLPGSVTGVDTRQGTAMNLSQLQLQYMISPEYHQLMYQQMAAAAAAQATGLPISSASSVRPGLINQTPNLSATLQAAVHGLVSTTQPLVDHNTMLMRQGPLSLFTPHSAGTSFTTSSDGNVVRPATPKDSSSGSVPSTSVVMATASIPVNVPALSAMAIASSNIHSLATASSNLYINAAQATGVTVPQFQSSQPTNIPVTNANSSPRPSILRKRTNEGMTVVKKPVCGLNTVQEKLPDNNSPRPDSRTDSAPQSNTSSPKTPATPAGESQSSTDTALSSEATTPTQNALSDLRIKQEPPDTIENGFPNSSSLPNSTETSPRKKPRKQLLHVNEELKDSSTSEDDDFEEDKIDIKDEDIEFRDEYVDDEGVRWTLEKNRPNISLLNFYNFTWKSRNNHFQRYTDVKPKDERRPTVNELSNQRAVTQKASGWKLYHMAAQMEDLTGLEKTLHQKVLSLQESIAPQPVRQHAPEDDSGLLHELTQANLQRSKLIADQLDEAKTSMLKVLDHKTKIFEIINKHMSKRPIKKKERS
ncbi:histone deacetylase complex subunit SAP130-like [Mytilus californianus]|uniref:histone deacetylase complex subunit SAP130-like n=1 Tax=Mytilus californianus TaxID=6549 RepID=UPI0022461445|nr:histone deacetylase complex subunit SAP130-like [Mytilus californianus]XP_052107065.1 histone deacetylase complex subunit SAP130-like [Mytilus californianus]